MAKVRKYPTVKEWKERVCEYLKDHKEYYIQHMLKVLKYEDLETLQKDEYSMAWGFDCGWVNLVPKNKEMAREWRLDNDGIPDYIWDPANAVYSTQSITIKQAIMEQCVKDMQIEDKFEVVERYD